MAELDKFWVSPEGAAQALMKQYGITKGKWTLAVEFSFAATVSGPSKDDLFPTALIGVKSLGLIKTDKEGPLTFDANELNPTEPKQARASVRTGITPQKSVASPKHTRKKPSPEGK